MTVTLQVAVLPLEVFAVMVAVPVPLAFIVPFETVATLLFEVVQVSLLFSELAGSTVPVIVRLSPLPRV